MNEQNTPKFAEEHLKQILAAGRLELVVPFSHRVITGRNRTTLKNEKAPRLTRGDLK